MDTAQDAGSPRQPARMLGGAVLDDLALDDLLQRVVELACLTVQGAHSVSITVDEAGRFRTSNSTEAEALVADLAQYHDDEGPCIEAIRSARQLQTAIGADEGRWPTFTAKARELGVVGVLSTPLLRRPGDAIGALNIYGSVASSFGEAELRTADAIAGHASVLIGSATALAGATQLNQQLSEAVASREIIGEAKGILMERERCTRDEAFDILRRASQRENRKLRDLAEELVRRVEAGGLKSGPESESA